ncbi:MAG: cytochrome c oxidase subunit II [Proteobacteria bacterium]|nr:cytochrome c oxidase subunit II [Pseudomonadota bacterium]
MIEQFVEAGSTYARNIDNVILLIGVLVGFWWALSTGVFFGLILKYRAKPGVRAKYVPGTSKVEKKFINIPHGLVLVCDVLVIIAAVQVWVHVKQTLPEPDYEIRIIGQQWAWTFQHPGADGELDTDDDIRLVDELHIEVDKNYVFHLEATDVMHSFSVPIFRLKQDAIPGRTITGWFNATITGEYDIQCAEMCGIGHGVMGARIHIERGEQHAAWVADQTPTVATVDAQ